MESRKVVALVVLVAVVGGLTVFVGIPAIQTEFQYERAYPTGETKHVWLRIVDFSNPVNVNVTFVDDSGLMYRIDVVQEISGVQHGLIYQEPSWDPTTISVKVVGLGEERVSTIDVVLGTGTPYDLSFEGQAMNVTVVFDNNAVISPRESDTNDFDVNAACYGGVFTFVFTENVQFNNTGILVHASVATNILLAIDLPDGMNGRLECPWEPEVSFITSGWSILSSGIGLPTIYGTGSIDEPLVDIIGSSGYIIGYLRD